MNKRNKYFITLLLLIVGLGVVIIKLINTDKFYSHAQQQTITAFTIKKTDEEGNKLENVEFDIYGKPTFSYETEKTQIEIEKIWNDNDNELGVRPESVKVKVYKDGAELQEIILNEENNWKYKIDNLEKYDGEEEIIYTIDEEEIEYYTKEIDGYTITNKIEDGLEKIQINKNWDFYEYLPHLNIEYEVCNSLNYEIMNDFYSNAINIKNNILKNVRAEFNISGSDGSYFKLYGKYLEDLNIATQLDCDSTRHFKIIGTETLDFLGKEGVTYNIQERVTLEDINTDGFEFEYTMYYNNSKNTFNVNGSGIEEGLDYSGKSIPFILLKNDGNIISVKENSTYLNNKWIGKIQINSRLHELAEVDSQIKGMYNVNNYISTEGMISQESSVQ